MENSIKGSRSEKNLLKAFAGESQAKNRYTFYSKQAKKEGFEQIAAFFAETALEHERTGEMIERIGLVNFLEGIGLEIDANMVSTPRTNPYVRTDGWDDEVAKINARKAAA